MNVNECIWMQMNVGKWKLWTVKADKERLEQMNADENRWMQINSNYAYVYRLGNIVSNKCIWIQINSDICR